MCSTWNNVCFLTKLLLLAQALRSVPGQQQAELSIKHRSVPPQQMASVLRAVKAQCREGTIQVAVDRDLLGLGQLIQPSDINLGGCPFSEQDNSPYLFAETALRGCQSTLQVIEDFVVFSFTLNYKPSAIDRTPIVRANAIEIGIHCHYLRSDNGSSIALTPTQIPFTSTEPSEAFLEFSLKLMADDWHSERPSNVYFLGDVIHIEASVALPNHVPVRLFVDSCVATLVPDVNTAPRYVFVENKGCLIDAKLTQSNSHFMPRSQDHKLLLQLEAFRFYEEVKNSIYINCHLMLMAASQNTNFVHKTCYTEGSRWRSVDGNDQVCSCCDSTCDGPDSLSGGWLGRPTRGQNSEEEALELEGDASVTVFVQQREIMVEAKKAVLKPVRSHRSVVGVVCLVAVLGLACVAVLLYRRRRRMFY